MGNRIAVVFDVGVYLFKNLHFLDVGKVIFGIRHWICFWVDGWFEFELSPDSLHRIGVYLNILADENEGMFDGLGDEKAIEWVAMMQG